MEQILQRFLVQTLCAKLALCRIAAATYSEALLSPTLPGPERITTFRCWEKATREGDTLAFALEMISRRERNAVNGAWVLAGSL
jgi:hypothetical protein